MTLLIVVGFICLMFLYFMPALLATSRDHRDHLAILMVNIIFGWTLIGWVFALIWACTGNIEPKTVAEKSYYDELC